MAASGSYGNFPQYPARLTAKCTSGVCLALGNAYSAALQQDKAVDALRAGLSAIEQMPAAAQWDNDRYCLHINIGNQYLKERLAQLCITEYAVAESIAQRGGDPVQRQSRLEEVAGCRRIVETSLFGTAWDPAASIKRANDPDAAVHSRTHAMRDIINLSEEHEEQLRWLLKLEGYLAEVGLPAVNRNCPVCFDNFVTDTAPGRSGIDLMKVSMCNHVAHRGCLAQMTQVAEDKANRNGGVSDGIPCPSCNNRMTSGLSLSKVTAGGRVASTKTARVNRRLVAGDRVRIHGLVSRPELNGRTGTATVLTEGSDRWAVQLKDRTAAISVKIANLVIAGEGVPIDLKQHREMAAVADRGVTQANAAR